MIVRQIFATAALGIAFLGTPVAAAYGDIGDSLAVFAGGLILASLIAFWPQSRGRR